MDLYSKRLLALSRDTTHRGLLDHPTHTARVTNTLCGDEVEVTLAVQRDFIHAIGWETRACAICQASAAHMAALLEGAPLETIASRRAALERALADAETDDPEFETFTSVSGFPSRHGCALLPWRALEDALLDVDVPSSPEPVAHTQETRQLPLTAWDAVLEMRARGQEVALATLVSIVGSSPCPLGSRMVIGSDGAFWGAVSGGCVESAVVQSALGMLAEGDSATRMHTYQISNSQAGAVGLPCGGQIRVHIAPCPLDEDVRAYVGATEVGAARVLDLHDGSSVLFPSPEDAPAHLRDHVAQVLSRGEPVEVPSQGTSGVFVEPLQRPPRLLLVGGTQVAQKLCALAAEVGYDPVLVDPRLALANPDRFPGVTLHNAHPSDVLADLIDARTAVVMLTHDEKLDDPGLVVALASPAFYVAALGSRKTQRARLARLRAAGVPDHQLARLRGPAGLSIGAKGAPEIALSILAEVVQTHRANLADPVVGALIVRRSGDPDPSALREACAEADLTPLIVSAASGAAEQESEDLTSPADAPTSTLIREGVAALLERAALDAIVVLHADAPTPSAAQLRALAGAHSASTQHLVITWGTPGAPRLWPRRNFTDLLALSGPQDETTVLDAAPGALLTLAGVEGER